MGTKTVKEALNDATPGTLATILAYLKFGNVLRSGPTALRGKAGAADASVAATAHSIGLAEDARAAQILRGYARVGTGTCGELTINAPNDTPNANKEVAIAPNGDIILYATDAYTKVDIDYVPLKGEVVELDLAVASNSMAIPSTYTTRGLLYLLKATVTAGDGTGVKIIESPSASAASTDCARFDLAKTHVKFDSADAATRATVRLLVASVLDVDAALEANSTTLI